MTFSKPTSVSVLLLLSAAGIAAASTQDMLGHHSDIIDSEYSLLARDDDIYLRPRDDNGAFETHENVERSLPDEIGKTIATMSNNVVKQGSRGSSLQSKKKGRRSLQKGRRSLQKGRRSLEHEIGKTIATMSNNLVKQGSRGSNLQSKKKGRRSLEQEIGKTIATMSNNVVKQGSRGSNLQSKKKGRRSL